MRLGADPRPTYEAVLARAGGRCEECGARAPLRAVPMLEGLPQIGDTLALCEACAPRVVDELSAIASIPELHAAIAEKLARAAAR